MVVQKRLSQVADWAEEISNAHFSVHELAHHLGCSSRTLQRYFRKKFLMTPRELILEVRNLKACVGLMLSHEAVKQVAASTGYSRPGHFCRQFKKVNRRTPGEAMLRG